MSDWIPSWATHAAYRIDGNSCQIYFFSTWDRAVKEAMTNGIAEWVAADLDSFKKTLAIADVCEQIKAKPMHSRIDVVGQNGNDALVYKERPDIYDNEQKRSKYHREIKPGVWVDVYDVLNAFGVKCHALAHAIKKLLMPGERGAKGYKQDCEEAIQSVKRSIDEWG